MLIQIEMEQLFCGECGIAYCVPKWLAESRARDEEDIHCPNGHTTTYKPFKPSPQAAESEQVKEMRRQTMLAIHEADQAAARAENEAGKSKPDGDPAEEFNPKPVVIDGGKLKCPYCTASYKLESAVWMARHLRRNHDVDPEDSRRAVARAMKTAEGAGHE